MDNWRQFPEQKQKQKHVRMTLLFQIFRDLNGEVTSSILFITPSQFFKITSWIYVKENANLFWNGFFFIFF